MRKLLFLLLVAFNMTTLFAQQEDTTLFQRKVYVKEGHSLPYRILFPKNYNPKKSYPLVLFLHGSGERGTDNGKQLKNGGQWLVDNLREKHPAIAIVPQCPENDYWAHVKREVLPKGSPMMLKFTFYKDSTANESLKLVMALLEETQKTMKIDSKRIYVGGLSMGGLGTYELLTREPNKFAAALIICGAVNLDWFTEHNKKTPMWLFHGAIDQVVSVDYAREAYKRLNDGKREIKYTEYPNVNHDSWNNVFKEPGVFDWLFSHKK